MLKLLLQQLSRRRERKHLKTTFMDKVVPMAFERLTSRDVPLRRFIWSSCQAVGREMYSGSILTYSVHGPETLNLILGSDEALVTCINKNSITSPRKV